MIHHLSHRGWNLTCNTVIRQPAKSTWSSSSCPAESREHSGIRSRSWFWTPQCHSHTRSHWRGNLGVSERQTRTALKDKGTKNLLERLIFWTDSAWTVLFGRHCYKGQQIEGWLSLHIMLTARLSRLQCPETSQFLWLVTFQLTTHLYRLHIRGRIK